MKKMSCLSCMTSALFCLTIGNAVAENEAASQQVEPKWTNDQDNPSNQKTQPKIKEEADRKKPPQSSASTKEPECN